MFKFSKIIIINSAAFLLSSCGNKTNNYKDDIENKLLFDYQNFEYSKVHSKDEISNLLDPVVTNMNTTNGYIMLENRISLPDDSTNFSLLIKNYNNKINYEFREKIISYDDNNKNVGYEYMISSTLLKTYKNTNFNYQSFTTLESNDFHLNEHIKKLYSINFNQNDVDNELAYMAIKFSNYYSYTYKKLTVATIEDLYYSLDDLYYCKKEDSYIFKTVNDEYNLYYVYDSDGFVQACFENKTGAYDGFYGIITTKKYNKDIQIPKGKYKQIKLQDIESDLNS